MCLIINILCNKILIIHCIFISLSTYYKIEKNPSSLLHGLILKHVHHCDISNPKGLYMRTLTQQ